MRRLVMMPLALIGFLAGCVSPYEKGVARMNAAIDARLSNAVGGTVADFVAQTGAQPRDFYDQGLVRLFVFDSGFCRIRLISERIGPRASPKDWRVVGVDHAGRCEQVVAD